MSEAERTGLDHVVLPRRRPGLALLERHRPSPADNILDAELAAFAAAGDTVQHAVQDPADYVEGATAEYADAPNGAGVPAATEDEPAAEEVPEAVAYEDAEAPADQV